MTDAIQSSDTAIDFGSGGPAVLKKKWIVPPPQTTSRQLDGVTTHRRKSEAPILASSSTSFRFEDSDIIERLFEKYIAHNPVFNSEMLEAIESIVIQLFTDSADISTPVVDDLSTHLDASTAKNEVDRLFSLAMYIDLEPGMENAFSRGLEKLIARHGDPALSEIQSFILEERTKSSIAMEALQYIGRMDSNRWKTERRKLLEQCLLRSRSAWVRDGAGLGLASLDDPRSIGAVKTAIAKESSNSLKKDLKSVLEQLEATRSES